MRTIDGHTFDESLFTKDGWIVDAGARRFTFSIAYPRKKVYAIDIENFEDIPGNTIFKHAALMNIPGMYEAHYFGDGSANFVKGLNEQPYNGPDRPCETKTIEAICMKDVYDSIGTNIDLLKLDIELAEYKVLLEIEPIPRQISCEFHSHTNENYHELWIGKVLAHMSEYYKLTQFPCDHWPRYKFMDCLFTRKDLL